MTKEENELIAVFLRSSLLLAALITVPVALISGVFGPLIGLLAFGAAIPLCAHIGGAVPLGLTSEAALERLRDPAELRLIGMVTALCVLFGLNLLLLIPEGIRQVPVLPIVERQPPCPRATTILAGFQAAEVGVSFNVSG
jgi:O-antigen/teichoic acid export membrane protein